MRQPRALMTVATRHAVAVIGVAAVLAYAWLFGRLDPQPPPIRSDGYSYYVYLPAVFIYHDPTFEALGREWYGGTYPDWTGLRRWPDTGRWVNLHPIGTAVMMMPFFLAADALTWWSNFPRDGFSVYYQHGAALAGLSYMVLGLALLRRLLSEHFSDGIVLATLVSITWATNLFHYGVFDSAFSHAFAFCLVSAWLYAIDRWWRDPTTGWTLAIGLLAGLIVLVRHTNIIFLAVLPLYGVGRWSDVVWRSRDLWRRKAPIAVAAIVAVIVVAPQIAMYSWSTGHLMANSYETYAMRPSLTSPHFLDVLFSTQKGLFFWSPLLLLCIPGVLWARGWARGIVLAATCTFVAQAYLVGAWPQWQYGASFGHRAFTDGLALAAPLLASAFQRASNNRPACVAVSLFAAAAVCLSVAQMYQYWIGILPMADTTWAQYRHLFLRFR